MPRLPRGGEAEGCCCSWPDVVEDTGDLQECTWALASFDSHVGSHLLPARAAVHRVSLAHGKQGSKRHSVTEFSPWATAGVLPYTQRTWQHAPPPQPHSPVGCVRPCWSALKQLCFICNVCSFGCFCFIFVSKLNFCSPQCLFVLFHWEDKAKYVAVSTCGLCCFEHQLLVHAVPCAGILAGCRWRQRAISWRVPQSSSAVSRDLAQGVLSPVICLLTELHLLTQLTNSSWKRGPVTVWDSKTVFIVTAARMGLIIAWGPSFGLK